MRLIDADAFEAELNERLLPVLIERYGRDEALRGLHFSFRDFICNIQTQPAIEPEQGKWIVHFNDLFPAESTEECSICHAEQLINGNDDNFCPNCGARMEGER